MIIDVHGHIGRFGGGYKRMVRTGSVDATALVRNMDRYGIEKTCVLPLADSPEGWYLKSTTEDIITACSEYPDRLIPFCLIDPRFGDNRADTDFTGLLAEYKERGCRGMGEVVAQLPFDDAKLMNLYGQVGDVGFPIIFDMNISSCYGVLDEPELPRLERALKAYPQTTFVGHGPTFWAGISGDNYHDGYPMEAVKPGGPVPRLMEEYDNLWADLSAGSGYGALTRDKEYGFEFLEKFQDKLMFGTDAVHRDEDCMIVDYFEMLKREKRISAEAHDKITSGNAIGLLGL